MRWNSGYIQYVFSTQLWDFSFLSLPLSRSPRRLSIHSYLPDSGRTFLFGSREEYTISLSCALHPLILDISEQNMITLQWAKKSILKCVTSGLLLRIGRCGFSSLVSYAPEVYSGLAPCHYLHVNCGTQYVFLYLVIETITYS